MQSNTIAMKMAQDVAVVCIKAGLVPFIKGSPGVGKSAIVKEIADHFDMELIDLRLAQCEPTDLLGFPSINKETHRAEYVPMDSFPLDTDELPKGKKGWLLFLDEFNSADRDVQKAAYKLVLDRQVGKHNLHPNVRIVAAGNLESDQAIVEELSSALKSRISHMEVRVDHDEWLSWARKNGIDSRITSFINWKPGMIYKFDPDSSDDTYPCPRTWEFASRLLDGVDKVDEVVRNALLGTVGQGAIVEFLAHMKVASELPDFNYIVKNAATMEMPTKPSTQYALAGAVGTKTTEDTIAAVMPFIERMPVEFQVITFREMVGRNQAIINTQAATDWITKNSSVMFD